MTLSIVIPTLDRLEPLCQTLESIARQSKLPEEIIVIDQSRTLEPKQAVEKAWQALPHSDKIILKYLIKTGLSGSSEARNVGIDLASSEVILFLDDDVILEPDFLERVLEPYSDESVGGVGGVITNYDPPAWPDRILRTIFFRGPFFDSRQQFYWNAAKLRHSGPSAIDRLGGGLMSFRRNVCQTVRFDLNFTGYSLGEDVDFSYNVSRRWKVLIHPQARLIHLRSPGTRPKTDWRLHEMRSYAYLYRKNWATGFKNRLAFLWLRTWFLIQVVMSSLRARSTAPLEQWRAAFTRLHD